MACLFSVCFCELNYTLSAEKKFVVVLTLRKHPSTIKRSYLSSIFFKYFHKRCRRTELSQCTGIFTLTCYIAEKRSVFYKACFIHTP